MQKHKTIDEFLTSLDAQKRQQVDLLRELIKQVEPRLIESIKWNAPSYAMDGEDRITFNVVSRHGLVKLVLHMGAKRVEDKKSAPVMADKSDLIEWASDCRGVITFTKVEEIEASREVLCDTIKTWLSIPVETTQ